MTDCVFCRIVAGTEPRHHVWEDEQYLAMLTKRPLMTGHLLIIPKAHVDYFFDMDENLYRDIFMIARRIEPALKKFTDAKRIGLAVEGFGVSHAHLHLIPMMGHGGLDSQLAHDVPEDELSATAEQLRQALS